jgi:hypothetical protein
MFSGRFVTRHEARSIHVAAPIDWSARRTWGKLRMPGLTGSSIETSAEGGNLPLSVLVSFSVVDDATADWKG